MPHSETSVTPNRFIKLVRFLLVPGEAPFELPVDDTIRGYTMLEPITHPDTSVPHPLPRDRTPSRDDVPA